MRAKVCIVDDRWTSVESDNINLRSWTHDSELSVAIADDDPDTGFARDLRLRLDSENLERPDGDDADLVRPADLFTAYAQAPARLDGWYVAGRRGPRPAGRLGRYREPHVPRLAIPIAALMYRIVADPDGRPPTLRPGPTPSCAADGAGLDTRSTRCTLIPLGT